MHLNFTKNTYYFSKSATYNKVDETYNKYRKKSKDCLK